MIVPLRSTGLFLNPGPSDNFFLLLHSIFISKYPSPLPPKPKLRCWMHQTSPPTLQVLLGWARCIWSQIFCLLPSFPSYPKEFGVFHPGTAPSVPGEESSVLRPAVGWFGFLGASSSRRTRTQEHPNPKGISCSAGRLSWRCHCHTKPWGHWGQREGQTTGFDLHRAKPQREKLSLGDRVWEWLWNVLGGEGMIWG